MVGVTFLTVHSSRGNVAVTGPVTGIPYEITSKGTPVSNYDVDDLLAMIVDPCCGQNIPFDAKVRLFGKTAPSRIQLAQIPLAVLNAEPLVREEPEIKKSKRSRKKPVEVEVEDSVVSVTEEEPEVEEEEPQIEEEEKEMLEITDSGWANLDLSM